MELNASIVIEAYRTRLTAATEQTIISEAQIGMLQAENAQLRAELAALQPAEDETVADEALAVA